MGCISCKDRIKPQSQDLKTLMSTVPIFIPAITSGRVIKVYDGDTIWVLSKYNGEEYRFNLRLYGYDSPELRSKNKEEKEAAISARDYLADKILGKRVRIEVIQKKEKYGRLLSNVFLGNLKAPHFWRS